MVPLPDCERAPLAPRAAWPFDPTALAEGVLGPLPHSATKALVADCCKEVAAADAGPRASPFGYPALAIYMGGCGCSDQGHMPGPPARAVTADGTDARGRTSNSGYMVHARPAFADRHAQPYVAVEICAAAAAALRPMQLHQADPSVRPRLAASPEHLRAQILAPGADAPQLSPPRKGLDAFLCDKLEGSRETSTTSCSRRAGRYE